MKEGEFKLIAYSKSWGVESLGRFMFCWSRHLQLKDVKNDHIDCSNFPLS